MEIPVIVVLNMLDVAEQQGLALTPGKLEEQLGLPCHQHGGIPQAGRARVEGGNGQRFRGSSRTKIRKRPIQEVKTRKWVSKFRIPCFVAITNLGSWLTVWLKVCPTRHSLSERLDSVVLNRWLGVPIFLLMIYLMFTFAVNFGAIFIDFFDILFATVLGRRHQLAAGKALNAPYRDNPAGAGRRRRHYPSGDIHSSNRISLSQSFATRRFGIYVEGGICD
jgi:ferrous iron transport protein B